MGSISDAKKAPVENIASVIEIFETFIAAKNVIQCKAMTIPAVTNFKTVTTGTLREIFLILMKSNIKNPAISIRYQTSGMALRLIASPNMDVKPAIKTRK